MHPFNVERFQHVWIMADLGYRGNLSMDSVRREWDRCAVETLLLHTSITADLGYREQIKVDSVGRT